MTQEEVDSLIDRLDQLQEELLPRSRKLSYKSSQRVDVESLGPEENQFRELRLQQVFEIVSSL